MEMLSEHHVPGLARGLPADRPARVLLLLRGVRPHHRLDVQPARQVAEGLQRHPVAAADRVAQLPAHLATSGGRTTTASPTRTRASSITSSTRRPRSSASTCRRTPTALLSRGRPLPAQPRTTSTSIVAGKQPRPQWLTWTQAIAHCTAGRRHLGVGEQRRRRRAGRGDGLLPATCRRSRRWPPSTCCAQQLPDLKIRVVNVVDLMKLQPRERAPARAVRPRLRRAVHHATSRSSSPSTATRG